MFEYIRKQLNMEEIDIVNYSPLTLAYIGDSIYELLIRTMIVAKGNTSVNKLHQRSARLVKASAQAQMILGLKELLTEEEMAVYKRGRNAKSYTMAKNATMKDYRNATGLEALMGYLYLTKQDDRMMELVRQGLEIIDGRNE